MANKYPRKFNFIEKKVFPIMSSSLFNSGYALSTLVGDGNKGYTLFLTKP